METLVRNPAKVVACPRCVDSLITRTDDEYSRCRKCGWSTVHDHAARTRVRVDTIRIDAARRLAQTNASKNGAEVVKQGTTVRLLQSAKDWVSFGRPKFRKSKRQKAKRHSARKRRG